MRKSCSLLSVYSLFTFHNNIDYNAHVRLPYRNLDDHSSCYKDDLLTCKGKAEHIDTP